MKALWLALSCALWVSWPAAARAGAADLAALCADRLATERVYYDHRLGAKPPFAQAMPAELSTSLVKTDLKKETVLRRVYGVSVTDQMVQAEVERINNSTRAPDVLFELKQALGNDPLRFARTVARPIVVERLLRERFDNDDALHASQRCVAAELREQLLQAKKDGASLEKLLALLAGSHAGTFSEMTWQLASRPADQTAPASSPSPAAASTTASVQSTGGPFIVQASAQPAQALPQPGTEAKDSHFYFADLPLELQQALRAHLRQPGDVSALIDMPSAFFVYLLKHRSAAEMTAAAISFPKLRFDDWLAVQPDA